MSWLELRFRADEARAAQLAEALEELGAESVSIESDGDEPRFALADEPTALWSRNRVTGLFPADTDPQAVLTALSARLGSDAPPPPEVDTLADRNWTLAWREHYRPLAVTPGLWICPGWIAPPQPEAVNILIDPGLAFGTGTHATTLLCLRWLARQQLTGATVIDYGCGSGILAIAALRLGAARAIGVDLDPVALEVSRENAARNGVAGLLTLWRSDELPAATRAELLVANILANPLIALAPQLSDRVRPGGRLALSGMLAGQAAEVSKHYAQDFDLETETLDGWAILEGPKRR